MVLPSWEILKAGNTRVKHFYIDINNRAGSLFRIKIIQDYLTKIETVSRHVF
jgi:hypothetical protein